MAFSRVAATVMVLAFCGAAPAGSEIYRWTEASGALRFTDSLEQVPVAWRTTVDRIEAAVRSSTRLQRFRPVLPVSVAALHQRLSVGDREDVVVPFRRHGNLMKVDVRLNDHLVAPFYVDTAASGVVLPAQIARELGLEIGPDAPATNTLTANGVVRMTVVRLDSVELDGARVNDLEGLVSDQLEVGLLGGAFLRHFNYSIDGTTGTISLEPIGGARTAHR